MVISMKRKLRFMILGTASCICIIYFVWALITFPSNIRKLKIEEQEKKQYLESLKEDAENLKVEIEKLKDPEYIARFARENFFYSKATGEYIIKIEKKEKEEITLEPDINTNSKTNNMIIFAIGIILIGIIIYIKIRSKKTYK